MTTPDIYVVRGGQMHKAERSDHPAQRYVTFEQYEALEQKLDEAVGDKEYVKEDQRQEWLAQMDALADFDVRKITVSVAETVGNDGVTEVKAKSVAEVEELLATLSEAKDDFHESWVTASKDNERLTKALTWIVKAPRVSGDNGPDMKEQMRIVAKAALENEDISDKLKKWAW